MDDFQKLLLETFAEEARDTVQALENALLALEGASTPAKREAHFATLARSAHNLKGAAGAAGVGTIQSLSHALEDALLSLRASKETPEASMFDILYAGVDTIRLISEGEASLHPTPEGLKHLEDSLRAVIKGEDSPSVPPTPTPESSTQMNWGETTLPSPELYAPPSFGPAPPVAPVAPVALPTATNTSPPSHQSPWDPPVPVAPPTPFAPPTPATPPVPFALPIRVAPPTPLAPPTPATPPVPFAPVYTQAAASPAPNAWAVSAPNPLLPAPPVPQQNFSSPAAWSEPTSQPIQSIEAPLQEIREDVVGPSSVHDAPKGSVAPSSKNLPYREMQATSLAQTPTEPPSAKAPDAAPSRMVRVSVEKLNTLMNQIGEIITVSKKTETRLLEMDDIAFEFEETRKDLKIMSRSFGFVLQQIKQEGRLSNIKERFDNLSDRILRLEKKYQLFRAKAARDAATEQLLTEQLPEDIKRLRMRPFKTLEDYLRRSARDAARRCEKNIHLNFKGLDTEADQVVLDALREPLVHLLRNCIDHGIESPEERIRLGKPKEGVVTLHIEGHSATVLLSLEDDGRGIDSEKLRTHVLKRNLVPEHYLRQMGRKALIDLIFFPGFSTANKVGMVSGRGIGMDIVRQTVQQHHGTVTVESKIGVGTKFKLTMPLTFATVQGIIVKVEGHELALPIYSLKRLVKIKRDKISYVEGIPTIDFNNEPLSLVSLAGLLDLPPIEETPEELVDSLGFEHQGKSEKQINAAIVQHGDRRVAFVVDDFIGESEMVIKTFPELLGKIQNVSGATISWSGEVMVILNPSELIKSALQQRHSSGGEIEWNFDTPISRRILVCDDSLTTRTLETNILTAEGYDVEGAVNGLDGLRLIEKSDFQLLILDVDMPEMSGFELTLRLRSMPKYQNLPIILVTSRDSEEDKRKGLAAGADAYITKQGFTQRGFLETVRRFLE